MGTVSNANPNPNPNPNPYPWIPKDCSSGICSIYCPQWCYIVNSPPPPSLLLAEDSPSRSAFEFSPLIVAVMGVVASALVLLSYYTLVWKVCGGRGRTGTGNESAEGSTGEGENGNRNRGLEESVIKSISVRKYVRGSVVEPRECSVCLSHFQDNQTLRLLPPCNHAFHLPCIDPWLYSHSTCPLCRSTVTLP